MQSILHHGRAEQRHHYRDSNRCCAARQPPHSGATAGVAIEITIPQLLVVSILVDAPGELGHFIRAVGAARGEAAQGVSHVGASGIVGNVGIQAGSKTLRAGGCADFLVANDTSRHNGSQQLALGNVKEALQVGCRSIRVTVAEKVTQEIVLRILLVQNVRILLVVECFVGRDSSSLERQHESQSQQAENCGKLHRFCGNRRHC